MDRGYTFEMDCADEQHVTHLQELQQSGSVLVVDDSPSMLMLIEHILSTYGYQVHTRTSAHDALDLLAQQHVDIILSDVVMPQMDGYLFQSSVREIATLAQVPFIFLTSLDDKDERYKAKSAGADDYLLKPPDPTELLAVVQGKISRAKQQQESSEKQFERYRRRIINTLSHEFRTPMVSIRGVTDLLLIMSESGNFANAKDMLTILDRGVERMNVLIENFITLQKIHARLSMNQKLGAQHICSLHGLVNRALERCKPELDSKEFSYSLTDHSDAAQIRGVEAEVARIVDEFIRNGIKFSRDQREIAICTSVTEHSAIVEVFDRGIGFNPAKLEEALEPFGQLDRERDEQQGGGLGLAIASGFATLHDGTITVERRAEGGSVARLTLPLAAAAR